MDPDAVWKMLCEAMELLSNNPHYDDARELTIECLENLAQWLRRGGFPPNLTGGSDAHLPRTRPGAH
jgi:hypothetical protein